MERRVLHIDLPAFDWDSHCLVRGKPWQRPLVWQAVSSMNILRTVQILRVSAI